jgi:parvulin-like peptidyl-prolyl isomerase
VSRRRSSSWLREPLLHFLVLGAALFLLYDWFGDAEAPVARDRIVVDEAELTRLSQQFRRTWLRPPTRTELAGLAEDFVREEILYREALALGLDKNDLVIRRRLRQKMEFLNADLTMAAPTEADLEAYLRDNPDAFRRPASYSFRQVFVQLGADDGEALARARALLARLRSGDAAGDDANALGDPTLLPAEMQRVSAREIANNFGTEFAAELSALASDGWSGPLRSAYGLHLVELTAKEPGGLPALEEVRPLVEREWTNARRQAMEARFYEALRGRYEVEIRLPDVVAAKRDGSDGQVAVSR